MQNVGFVKENKLALCNIAEICSVMPNILKQLLYLIYIQALITDRFLRMILGREK